MHLVYSYMEKTIFFPRKVRGESRNRSTSGKDEGTECDGKEKRETGIAKRESGRKETGILLLLVIG